MLKLLIIDDESEVRDLLSILLRNYAGVEVVGQASNVDEGIRMTIEKSPDLVLLDIQMPQKDGFMYLDELDELKLYPGVIFVTAFENYAVRAIKKSAFDYLLKPISKEELFEAIARFEEVKKREHQPDIKTLIKLLSQSKPGKLKLNTRTGYFFVDPQELIYCEADGNYSHIMLSNGKSEVSTISLGNLEKLLIEGSFFRVSRSYIINMSFISRVDRKANTCDLEFNGITHQIKIPSQKIKLLEAYFQD